jgi:hypothetical protein
MEAEPIPAADTSLADDITRQVSELLSRTIAERQPLEVDPWRSRLFELFVTADGAGLLNDEVEPNLSADVLCRTLATQWGLDIAAQQSVVHQEKLPAEQLARLRSLWSCLRLWMEWSYAWERWLEFHRGQ